jgi:hypothetical protein
MKWPPKNLSRPPFSKGGELLQIPMGDFIFSRLKMGIEGGFTGFQKINQ